nr:hypothetical protein [Tanacetum cinerariifolium]
MTTLAEHIIVARAENRPQMLGKLMHNSWASRIRPYTASTVTITAVPATNDSPEVPERTAVETILNMSPENKAHYESEKEAIHLLLTRIGDEIYLTVDACMTAHEMWIAIERLQQGESLNIQDVKTNLFWKFGKFTSHDGESMESYYSRFYKMMNEMIRNNLTDENYFCNLCGNNSHDDYDCQQQFSFVYEQEPSYNQNYNDNYYPHESLSFPCCDYCGGSHETFQCQPDNQKIDFSGSDQIQTPQYPDVNPPSLEISNEENFQAKGDLIKSIQTFLERFNCIPFEEKPQILFQTWETFFAIQCSQPEDSNELFQKLLKELKELAEYDQSTSTDRLIFLNDNEDHSFQKKESPENSSEENVVSKTNQEPPQDSNIHQLIDECYEEVLEKQKQNMEKTMLDLKEQEVKIVKEQPAERRNRIEKSLQNFRVIHKSSISLNTSQISSIHSIAPIQSTKEPEHSLSMGYEHLSITPETKSDEVTESNAKNLLLIPNECEVTLEDKRECDELICENSSTIDVCNNHSEILFDSNNDDLSSDDESFKDIEYVDASVPDPAIVSIEEENVVQREEEEVDLEDISQVQDVVLREKLFSITRLISNIESLNDNSTPDCVLNSFESDNSLLDNYSPEFETFCDHSEETRSEEVNLFRSDNSIPPGIENVADDPEGDIRFLEELLIDDSILSHASFDSSFEDNLLIPRPPPEPPDDNFNLEPEVISAVMEDIDEPDEHFNPGGEIFVSTNNEDVDYFLFMFVIRIFLPYLILPEISPLFLSAEKTRSGNTTHADNSLPEYDLFCFEIEPNQERLIYVLKNDISDDSSNDPLLEEVNLFRSDNSIPPGIENVADDPEGDIRFLEELLIDDSILSHASFDSSFEDNLLIPRPPPEPPDDNFNLEPEVISAVMEDIDEPDEHFNPGGE